MSDVANKLREVTSAGNTAAAMLVLEDGTSFEGRSCGAEGQAFGEICFNTSMTGYLEVISDLSYAGQIITMTYPQIGNYGVHEDDLQRDSLALRGLVVHDMCRTPASWRCQQSLPDFLSARGVVAIEGIDTRALVRHIREAGAQRAVVSTTCTNADELLEQVRASEGIEGVNLIPSVSCADVHQAESGVLRESHDFALSKPVAVNHHVVAYDCGAKDSIFEGLVRVGCNLTVVPWNTPAEDVLALNPDGVFLSNGPGDPDAVAETYEQVRKLLGKLPVFGICLGHQMICKAAGASMEKLKYGHRGGNQPVMNLRTHRVEITAQNHGFGLLFPSLGALIPEQSGGHTDHVDDLRFWVNESVAPVVQSKEFGRIQLTHVNLNDGTAEGVAFLDIPAFSVQYHPEAHPGPTDSHYLFSAFTRLMDGRDDYLDIDIAKDRLAGWSFSAGKEALNA